MTYIQKEFKPFDNRTTAQGAKQQEGKFPFNKEGSAPGKFSDVDEEGSLKANTSGATVSNDAGFNPAASTVATATQASNTSTGPANSQASNAAVRSSASAPSGGTGMSPQARQASGTGAQKVTNNFMSGKSGEAGNWFSKYKNAKRKNSEFAIMKQSLKGGGNAQDSGNLQSINKTLGVNLGNNA